MIILEDVVCVPVEFCHIWTIYEYYSTMIWYKCCPLLHSKALYSKVVFYEYTTFYMILQNIKMYITYLDTP